MSKRYFFAYYEWNGMVFPVSWIEEDGVPVGGHQKEMEGTKREINEAEFVGPLSVLESFHPRPTQADVEASMKKRPKSA